MLERKPGSHDRLKKATSVRLLSGNAQKRKIDRTTPASSPIGDAPDILDAVGRETWERVILGQPPGILGPADYVLATDFCFATSRVSALSFAIVQTNDIDVASKLSAELARWQRLKISCAKELGITPMTRSRLALPDADAEIDSKLAQLCGG